eukprot:m51a1_g4198 hypothetical protein (206) ;mRNA; f:6317-7072
MDGLMMRGVVFDKENAPSVRATPLSAKSRGLGLSTGPLKQQQSTPMLPPSKRALAPRAALGNITNAQRGLATPSAEKPKPKPVAAPLRARTREAAQRAREPASPETMGRVDTFREVAEAERAFGKYDLRCVAAPSALSRAWPSRCALSPVHGLGKIDADRIDVTPLPSLMSPDVPKPQSRLEGARMPDMGWEWTDPIPLMEPSDI